MWVPDPGWVHTLIAPPTDPRPAPSTGGRERAARLPEPETLRIPPHEGVAASESRTARDRGRNLVTTEILVRQLQALVTPGTQVSDDLVAAWIWWFNTHQSAQGGVCVPHLGWVHRLIAPATDPRPAPGTRDRERAAPPPRPETLRIPPQEGVAA